MSHIEMSCRVILDDVTHYVTLDSMSHASITNACVLQRVLQRALQFVLRCHGLDESCQ